MPHALDRVKSITSVINSYLVILQFLQSLAESNEDVASKARGLFDQFSKGEVYLGLRICLELFSETVLCLQKKTMKVAGASEAINVVLKDMHPETRSLFPELEKFLCYLLATPVTSAKAECSFSILLMLKSYLQMTMTQKREFIVYSSCVCGEVKSSGRRNWHATAQATYDVTCIAAQQYRGVCSQCGSTHCTNRNHMDQ
ncbi:hypothetical protein PR048_031471 [Dryococelus australis]|uniref:HAT C-terminal dimerisation domain-containing protein n=1 Tax=Dryococelus australis TaxID=614101 RepID=A0ABQ9G5C5_9NEOP|nr:hypothetical protein PR048_031471 [Dryococelus australis]